PRWRGTRPMVRKWRSGRMRSQNPQASPGLRIIWAMPISGQGGSLRRNWPTSRPSNSTLAIGERASTSMRWSPQGLAESGHLFGGPYARDSAADDDRYDG